MMKKNHHWLLLFLMLTACTAFAQTYKPTWQSLDSRPVPQWWRDGKFGIFIHWGVYSVPGYSKVGSYAEWYQNGLMSGDSVRIKYQKAKFGNRDYYDLKNDFKAELFNPDEWAKLFEDAGAKYIVLTSKHHDGFALWPSKEADRDFGFAWNAVTAGPHRDLIGDLFAAVRKTSVHPGMYYSLYEWFNPIYKTDKPKYVAEHMWPQMKELVNNYKPDVFWTDGEWDLPDETWKSKEFLSWMYNESPVKNSIVTYDRWGGGARFTNGAVFTPEYQPDVDFEDHAWEESRGMGYSYGYNRGEDAWDYNSSQVLILSLIDKVSRGGNFLLDIGPDEHGKIPPIMEERLLDIGAWLKINGEAIYSTVRWKNPFQWSDGRTDYKQEKKEGSSNNDIMLKLTVDPDAGYAVKESFFTYNPTTNSLYAILPKYPSNKKFVLKNTVLPAGTAISFLSTKQDLTWKQNGENVEIMLPEFDPNVMKESYAYVLKITNYGKYNHKPVLSTSYNAKTAFPTVTIAAAPGATVYYTTDGSAPTTASAVYAKPLQPGSTATIKAIAVTADGLPSNVAMIDAPTYKWMPAVKASSKLTPGIAYRYYEPTGKVSMKSVDGMPVKTGIATTMTTAYKTREELFALQFDGYVNIARDGIYTFSTVSDDGSNLSVDDMKIVDNDGQAGSTIIQGKAALRKGLHKVSIQYYDSGGGNSLAVFIKEGDGEKKTMDEKILLH